MKFLGQTIQKLQPEWTDTQIDTTENITYLHAWTVIMHSQITVQYSTKYHFFGSCDLDLEPMTLILKLDLDIIKMCLHAKNEVSRSKHSKVRARTDRHTHRHTHRQTDRQTDTHTHRQTDRQTDRQT